MGVALNDTLIAGDGLNDTSVAGNGTWVNHAEDRQPSRATRRFQARCLLLSGDLLAVAAAIAAVNQIRQGAAFGDEVFSLLFVLLPVYGVIAFNSRAYAHDALQNWLTGLRRALTSLVFTALVLVGVGFALKVSSDYSRVVLAGGVAVAALLITATRFASSYSIRAMLPTGIIDVALLVDGVRPQIIGDARLCDTAALGLIPQLDSPHMLDRIGRALHDSDRVVLACPPDRREAWISALKGLGNEVQVLMPELDTYGILGMARFDDQFAAVIARGPLRMSDMLLKRTFDIGLVLFCLPVVAMITAVVALMIKLDDGGPIFFRQSRMGRGNRIFDMLKFRSMRCEDADTAGALSASRDDARVTRVGYWLRRTSLDELPQLFNVLSGSMSIVGPRPHALGSTAENALFWEADNRYWLRHAVKPGLTGLAQVRGFRGATIKTSDLTNRVQADLEYLVGWTLWRDLRIMAGTVKVLFHPNAF